MPSFANAGEGGFLSHVERADSERELGVAIVNSGKPMMSLDVARLAEVVLRITPTFPRSRPLDE